ncbi:hypothetical protein AVDCRST_MAG81-4002 [uncultured Synechococcales cyanobacterium]|uniref:Uncharacterized protein n=1 Tax=uncultured Synechococcales cyanobacterium TaxID=1936017 RepID=A0A6J4VRA9_9CYAN|nr:hypothetical protein AVDCRST_MAG81-4002 [uncultured Synechococcales cyanobacterium]
MKSVRSSDSYFVKTSGLRWLSLMLLVDIPWAQRVWALPFFTVLAPSQRHDQSHGHRHKTLTDWARQMLTQVRRWLPHRAIVLVADSTAKSGGGFRRFIALVLPHWNCWKPYGNYPHLFML